MKLMHKAFLLLALVSTFFIGGCTTDLSGDSYSTDSVAQLQNAQKAVVLSARPVKITESGDNLVGKGAGAIAGGVLASDIGGGKGQILSTLGGALVGGMLGNVVENKLSTQQGMSYVVKTQQGNLLSVTQGAKPMMGAGQHVLVIYPAPQQQANAPQVVINNGCGSTPLNNNNTLANRPRIVPDPEYVG